METIHLTKLVKIGSSLGVVIPKQVLAGYDWRRGDLLVFTYTTEKHLSISRMTEKEVLEIKNRMRVINIENDTIEYTTHEQI